MMTEAWTIGSLDYGADAGPHRLLPFWRWLSERGTGAHRSARSAGNCRRSSRSAAQGFRRRSWRTREEETAAAAGRRGGRAGRPARPAGGKTPNLDQYTVNLTENARKGKIDPVLGRDFEIRQVVDILTRRRQNNPILVGEAGVGKTAVVEGFALARSRRATCPSRCKNVALRTLDLALLQAGAGVKGEFENRLKGLIDEVKSRPRPSSCSSTKPTP